MMRMRVHDVPDVVAGLLAVDDGGVFRLQTRKDTAPMFDDFWRLSVHFEPDERLAEDAAVCQRALHARMCTKVANAAGASVTGEAVRRRRARADARRASAPAACVVFHALSQRESRIHRSEEAVRREEEARAAR